jgi:hypothetical protein
MYWTTEEIMDCCESRKWTSDRMRTHSTNCDNTYQTSINPTMCISKQLWLHDVDLPWLMKDVIYGSARLLHLEWCNVVWDS